MSLSNPQQPLVSAGSLMATSATAQVLGGAMAVVWLAFNHIQQPANGITAQELEDALTLLFSTFVSLTAMIGHFAIALLAKKYLPQT